MAKLYNLARMTTATTGTGTITLGSAVSGWLSFAGSGVADGDTVTYAIVEGSNREIGRGVYTSSGTTLTRSVLKSTNSNAAISLAGAAQVFITAAAEDFLGPFGGLVLTTPPKLSAWTQYNSGGILSSHDTPTGVSILASTTSSTNNIVGLYTTAPATPYRIEALIGVWCTNVGGASGLGFSDGTKTSTIWYNPNNSGLDVANYSNSSTFGSFSVQALPLMSNHRFFWFAIADNGTNVYFRYSPDGVYWHTLYSVAKASGYLGASGYTNVGITANAWSNSGAGYPVGPTLYSWRVVGSAP